MDNKATSEQFLSDYGIWVWSQPKTREDGSVCWIANARFVPTKRKDNGLEIDPVAYKECGSIDESYEYAFNHLHQKKQL